MHQGDLLAQMMDELRGLRTEVRAFQEFARARFDQMDARMDRMDARLDQIVENTGAHWRDHESRIAALEAWVKRSGS
jgi:hypothetical protein